MDKNTIIGFVLIALILLGFSYINRPTEEQMAEQQEQQLFEEANTKTDSPKTTTLADSINKEVQLTQEQQDSINKAQYGVFALATIADSEEDYVIENNKLRLVVSRKGGFIKKATVKDYTTNSKKPLVLFNSEEDGTALNLTLTTKNDRIIETKDLYFTKIGNEDAIVSKGQQSFTFRLLTSDGAYIDYVYTLKADDYMIGFNIVAKSMDKVLRTNFSTVPLKWNSKIKQQERSKKFEDRYAQLTYKPASDDVDELSNTSDDEERLTTKVKWVAFKDQFFSTILIADEPFASADLNSQKIEDSDTYLKSYNAELNLPFDPSGKKSTAMNIYMGPNKFKTLKSYDKGIEEDNKLHLDDIIPLGWTIFGWINEYVIIPMFNFFSKYITSYGIIILLLTIIIKIAMLPLTYKSYMSTAKMRVLKPQIEEINRKIPASKPQERQMATMQLYRNAGVSPMGGCLPMLLQMPILFAMFTFFPAAIELRQQSFLWAEDLSSYDAIVTWDAQIPFITKYFGNHLSLFCLLMTLTNIFYTYINMKNTDTGQQQMPGMKLMMYLMPLMFLFIFNDYASGLSYYYFISTLFTIAQTYLFRAFVNEEKLLGKLKENQKNPKKKSKSKFMQRLEDMQKQQMEYQKQLAKERAKKH